jgi:hypothetical protein
MKMAGAENNWFFVGSAQIFFLLFPHFALRFSMMPLLFLFEIGF